MELCVVGENVNFSSTFHSWNTSFSQSLMLMKIPGSKKEKKKQIHFSFMEHIFFLELDANENPRFKKRKKKQIVLAGLIAEASISIVVGRKNQSNDWRHHTVTTHPKFQKVQETTSEPQSSQILHRHGSLLPLHHPPRPQGPFLQLPPLAHRPGVLRRRSRRLCFL
jgi:hypothetical protein